jgi:hypothetical protein
MEQEATAGFTLFLSAAVVNDAGKLEKIHRLSVPPNVFTGSGPCIFVWSCMPDFFILTGEVDIVVVCSRSFLMSIRYQEADYTEQRISINDK